MANPKRRTPGPAPAPPEFPQELASPPVERRGEANFPGNREGNLLASNVSEIRADLSAFRQELIALTIRVERKEASDQAIEKLRDQQHALGVESRNEKRSSLALLVSMVSAFAAIASVCVACYLAFHKR